MVRIERGETGLGFSGSEVWLACGSIQCFWVESFASDCEEMKLLRKILEGDFFNGSKNNSTKKLESSALRRKIENGARNMLCLKDDASQYKNFEQVKEAMPTNANDPTTRCVERLNGIATRISTLSFDDLHC